MEPTVLHPNAQPITEADLLAMAEADPLDGDFLGLDDDAGRAPVGVTTSADLAPPRPDVDLDIVEGMDGKDYQDGELLDPKTMGAGFKGSKFYVPEDSSEDVAAAGLANPFGPIANHMQVIVYDCRIRPQPVQKAKLRYYLTKPCGEVGHKHRAFYVTEARAIRAVGLQFKEPESKIPCRYERCRTRAGNRKLFPTEDAMENHFQTKHKRAAARYERERIRAREERMIAAQERQADLMATLLERMAGTAAPIQPVAPVAGAPHIHPATKAEAPASTDIEIPEGRPTAQWKAAQIVAWLDREGVPRPEKTGGMSRAALAALVPPEE